MNPNENSSIVYIICKKFKFYTENIPFDSLFLNAPIKKFHKSCLYIYFVNFGKKKRKKNKAHSEYQFCQVILRKQKTFQST